MATRRRQLRNLAPSLAPAGALLVLMLAYLSIAYIRQDGEGGYFGTPQQTFVSLARSGLLILAPFTLGLLASWALSGQREGHSAQPPRLFTALVGTVVSLPAILAGLAVTSSVGRPAQWVYEASHLLGIAVWGAPLAVAGLVAGLLARWLSRSAWLRLSRSSKCRDQG
ncbi:MAG: hypothetical protein MPN21_22995 [Thermoanaerobaculia bacterium]|nr:hypothetical protein [Thermoanaerobaculia bacterium]